MSNAIKINKSRLSKMIRESIEKYLNNIKLIHVITGKRLPQGGNAIDLCRMVYRNGLECFDNGEVGSCIWFWVNEPFYKEHNLFIVSLDYTPENKKLFDIYMDAPNAWAHKTIPFEYLNVESAPWVVYNNGNILFYDKLRSECHDTYMKFFNRWNRTNFETIDKSSFPWVVYTDVLPEEFLNLIPKNDNRFIFDKLFK